MATIPDLETRFRKRARSLVSPMAGNFDATEWRVAYDATPDTNDRDRELLDAALWVGVEAAALNGRYPDRLSGLSSGDATLLAVAMLNMQAGLTARDGDAARRAAVDAGATSFDYLANVRIRNEAGQEMSVGDFVEPAVESLESWLFDAARLPTTVADAEIDWKTTSERMISFYSLRRALKGLFDKALHLGTHLAGPDGRCWLPLGGDHGMLVQTWLARSEANFISEPAKLRRRWGGMTPARRRGLGLKKRVVSAGRNGSDVTLRITEATYLSKSMPYLPIDRAGLSNSYLAPFLDRTLPHLSGITPAMLTDAWWVIFEAADAISRGTPPSSIVGRDQALVAACAIRRDELARAVCECLPVTPAEADRILTFLTFTEKQKRTRSAAKHEDGGHRGLWSAPLVLLPGSDVILLPVPVFEFGSSTHRVEAWLEKGGIDDRQIEHRGDVFEAGYRASLLAAVRGNSSLPDAAVAPDGVCIGDDFHEQVDLLAVVGDRLLVGEIKFILAPTDPHHWPRFYAKLRSAAEQARRKARALAMRPDVVARSLGIGSKRASVLKVSCLIVLNSGYGFAMEVDGCRIVDAAFLRMYLNGNALSTALLQHSELGTAEKVTVLYASEQEAADRFDGIMARPPILDVFSMRIEWNDIPYPRPSGGTFHVRSPQRGDLSPGERNDQMAMINALNQR